MAAEGELLRETTGATAEAFFSSYVQEFGFSVNVIRSILRLYRTLGGSNAGLTPHTIQAILSVAQGYYDPSLIDEQAELERQGEGMGEFNWELIEQAFESIISGQQTFGQVLNQFAREAREEDQDQAMARLMGQPGIYNQPPGDALALQQRAERMRVEGIPQGFTSWALIFIQDLIAGRIPDPLYYLLNSPLRYILTFRALRYLAGLFEHAYRLLLRNRTSRNLSAFILGELFTAYFKKSITSSILDVITSFFGKAESNAIKPQLEANITQQDVANLKTKVESIEKMETGVPGIKQTEKSLTGNYEAPVFEGDFRSTTRPWYKSFKSEDIFQEFEQPTPIPVSDAPVMPVATSMAPITIPEGLMTQGPMGSQSFTDAMLRGIQKQRTALAGRKVPNFDLHKTKFDGLYRPYPQYEPLTPNDGKRIKLRKENKMSGIYPAYTPYEALERAY